MIYHLFVDRFAPGAGRPWNDAHGLDGFWGGTLRGVIEHLPYLSDLGVDCLWLSPIFPSPSHHGYDATDYHTIEPRLGSEADLRDLVDAAHARGIRVLLDFVANHLSSDHPIFRRAADDHDAPERRWFSFDRAGTYRSFFGVDAMARIDCDHDPAGAYLIDSAIHWLSLGVDGFRLDYANGPSHAFWSRFRASVREAKPDTLLIGEVVETAELQRSYAGRLDGALDFLLLQQMRAFFAFDTLDALAFASFLDRHFAYFPDGFVLPSFLDNHDMNRFRWVAGGDSDRLKLAALCQFTLPHPPIVYYGTEVGLSQRRDLIYPDGSRRLEESRLPMRWGPEQRPIAARVLPPAHRRPAPLPQPLARYPNHPSSDQRRSPRHRPRQRRPSRDRRVQSRAEPDLVQRTPRPVGRPHHHARSPSVRRPADAAAARRCAAPLLSPAGSPRANAAIDGSRALSGRFF